MISAERTEEKRGSVGHIDVKSLIDEARRSEHNESYALLFKDTYIRIGAGARHSPSEGSTLYLEVLVFLNPSTKVDTDKLQRKTTFLKELEAKGYTLSCQDESIISVEITTSEQDVLEDYEAIKTMIDRISTPD